MANSALTSFIKKYGPKMTPQVLTPAVAPTAGIKKNTNLGQTQINSSKKENTPVQAPIKGTSPGLQKFINKYGPKMPVAAPIKTLPLALPQMATPSAQTVSAQPTQNTSKKASPEVQAAIAKYNEEHKNDPPQYITNITPEESIKATENFEEEKKKREKSVVQLAGEYLKRGGTSPTYSMGDAMTPAFESSGNPFGEDPMQKYDTSALSKDLRDKLSAAAAISEKNPLTIAEKESADGNTSNGVKQFTYMTEEEKTRYNELYGIYGPSKAEEFRKLILDDINGRIAADIHKEKYDIKTEDSGVKRFGGTVRNTLRMLGEGVASGVRGLGETGEFLMGIDRSKAAPISEHVAAEIRSDEDNSGAANIAYDIAQSTGYMIPGIAATLATQGLGAAPQAAQLIGNAMFALSQAGNTYRGDINEGKNSSSAGLHALQQGGDEAITNALLGGVTEFGGGALKKLLANSKVGQAVVSGFDKLAKTDEGKAALRKIGSYMADMGSEALQEYVQFYTENITRNLIYGENNSVDPLDPDAWYSAALGALNAGILNAPTAIGNNIREKMDAKTLRATAELDIDKRRNEAESEGKSLEAYGTTDRARQVEFRKAELLAERFGASLEVGDTGTAQGQYQNGVISINKDTTDPVMDVFVHELTHHIETTDHYEAFSKFVTDYIRNDMQADVDMMKQAIIADYAENGVNLTEEGAQRELVAKFAESKLFKDEAAVNRLYQTDRTLFERIYYWINDTLTKVGGTDQEKMLLNAQKMFETAANSESSTKTGEIENLYAGQNSKIANINNLEKAIDMEQSGNDKEMIRQETGWFRGMDGKWRFEIADNNMSVDTTGMYSRNPDMRRYSELLKMAYIDMDATEEQLQELQMLDKNLQGVSSTPKYLDELVSHPTLFEAYPELRDIRVYFMDKLNPSGSTEGAYSPGFKEIVLKRSDILNKKKFKNNIIHEIQHAIQDIEGFSSGTNIEDANRALNGRIGELYTEQRSLNKTENEMIDQLLAKYSKMDEEGTLSEAEIDALAEKEYAELRENIKNSELGKAIQENAAEIKRLKGFSGYDYYENTAGEIEARDSASRRELDSEARRLAAPDIREDAVFAENTSGWSAEYDPEVASIKEQIENSKNMLNSMDIIASATVPENFNSKENAAQWAIEQLKYTGYSVERQDYGKIRFSKQDIGSGMQYADTAAEKAAILLMPKVLKKGIEIGAHTQHKNRSKNTVTFAAPVEMNGIRGNMAVVVNKNGDKYDAHRIVLPDGRTFVFNKENKTALRESSRGVTVSGSLAKTTRSAANESINDSTAEVKKLQKAEDMYEQKSVGRKFDEIALDDAYNIAVENNDINKAQEIVDRVARENGYSERLYHGTNRFGFTEFDLSKMDDDISIFTTTKPEVAETYSGGKGRKEIGTKPTLIPAEELGEYAGTILKEPYKYVTPAIKTEKIEEANNEIRWKIDKVKNFIADHDGAFDTDKKRLYNSFVDLLEKALQENSQNNGYHDKANALDWKLEGADWSLYDQMQSRIELPQLLGALASKDRLLNGDNLYINNIGMIVDEKTLRNAVKDANSGVYALYGKLDNMLILDAEGKDWNKLRFEDEDGSIMTHTRDVSEYAYDSGFDGVIIRNIKDNGDTGTFDGTGDVYVYFNPSSLKSADPVTYDDNGSIIPLSERFKESNNDIRYTQGRSFDELLSGAKSLAKPSEDVTKTKPLAKPEDIAAVEPITSETQQEQKAAAEPTKPTVDSNSYPVRSRAELKKEINKAFSIPEGLRSKVNQKLETIAQDIIERGQIREQDRQNLLEVLYDSGTAIKEADPTDKMVRSYLQGKKIYVSDSLKAEFGDDWQNIRNKLMGNKIYLTSDPTAMKPDVLAMEANEIFGPVFESDDMSEIIRDIADYADRGKDSTISLGEKADEISSLYGEGAGDDYYQEFNRKFDAALEKFADKAQIEMDYRQKLDEKVAAERAKWQESAQKKAERQRISEQNRKTLKDIQRLRKRTGYNDAKLTAALNDLTESDKQIADNAINNIATNAQRLTEKAKAKLQQNQEFYDKQLADDPNYIPDKKTLDLLSQMDKEYLKDKSLEELQDIHRVITALTQHIDDMDKEIGKNRHEKFETIYAQAKSEIQKAKGRTQKTGAAGFFQKFLTDEQLTPMNVIEMISGWNPDSAFYNHVGKQLEEAEFDAQRYQVEAERILEPFRKEHKEWITKADGQGKDAIWYEIEVPELLNYGEDGKPVFGETKKVYLTPAMKVELARGIRNYDNLRHAEGGVTFPNKDLYSKGQRRAAYSQGSTTLHIAPESMKKLFAYETLTDEEKALFKVSDKLFDEWAKGHINETGQLLDGMDRAIGGTYSKVYTNRDLQTTDLTIKQAIGDIGSLQSRVYSKTPMLAMSVFDAQEDTIDTVKKYCGYGPAVRNVQTLLNWSEPDGKNESMKTTIAEKWGPEIRDYLTSPTNGLIAQLSNKANFNDPAGSIADKVFSNYVSAVFGANPGIVIKQATSFPTFAAVLGFDTMPSVKQIAKVDAEEIYKYTPILEYRSLGYSDNEVAQLKNNPTALQKNPVTRFLTGGAITWMDRETVKAAWPWAENYVKKHYPDLKVGTDEFKQKQAEIYNDAVALTQPMYDNMHRANIMKSKGPVTRALTAFKTVPVQQQNTIRRLYGEWQNASLGQKAEKAKNFRTGALALVAAAAAYESVEFLNDMWKNKGKGYKDDEDELKAENILKKIGSDAAKDLGGMFIGFDEIVTAADKLSKNDIYSSGVISSPGIEQVNNFIDNVGKFGQTAGKAIGDTTTLLKNGGNVGQYIKDNSSELFGAVKDLAETMSMYFGGLPTRNLEKYILGSIRWADEGIAEEYAAAFDQTQKKDLKKVNGGALDVRTREYLESRVNTSDTSNKEIARLYDAIGVDAVPAEISSSYKINGEDIELDAAQKQKYQNAYRDAIGSSLDDLIASAAYKKLPDEKKAAAIAELYDYASEKGKEALGSEIDGAAKKLSEAAEGGLDIAEYAIALAETKGLSKKDEKVKAIFGSEISDETKGAVYEDFYGDNKALEAWKTMGGNAYDFVDRSIDQLGEKTIQRMADKGMTADEYIKYTSGTKPKLSDVPDKGFDTFKELKSYIGDPNNNENWHHIVEQSKGNNIAESKINNVNNVVSVAGGYASVHDTITAYYNSKQNFTDGKTVREWLSGKSFEEQFEFGMKQLQKYGSLVPTKKGWYFIPNEKALQETANKKAEEKAMKEQGIKTIAEQIDDGISNAGIDADHKWNYIIEQVDSEEYSKEDAIEWFNSNSQRTNSENYQSWLDNGIGDTWEYIRFRDVVSSDGDYRQTKITNYIRNYTEDDSLRRKMWALAGYAESSYEKNMYSLAAPKVKKSEPKMLKAPDKEEYLEAPPKYLAAPGK